MKKDEIDMAINRSLDEDKYSVADDFAENFDVDARPAQVTSTVIKSGWDAAESLQPTAGNYPVEIKHSEKKQLIRFLGDGSPVANYKQHFLSEIKEGRRSFVCLASFGGSCPLCEVGSRAESKRVWNIVNFSVTPFSRQIITASPRLWETLHNAHFETSFLQESYWSLSRTGLKQNTQYHIQAVKERDLEEDWGIKPQVAQDFLESSVPYVANEIVRETSYEDLAKIARAIS
jgi:hypothetical protein